VEATDIVPQMTAAQETPQPDADTAFAVMSTTGTLTWHNAHDTEAVEQMVAEPHPGTLARHWLGPNCPLRIMASDVFAVFPHEFAVNPLAERVIRGLSDGYINQSWRGTVAVYAHTDGFAETMPRPWVERIIHLAAQDG
jgi:hypothetical protein